MTSETAPAPAPVTAPPDDVVLAELARVVWAAAHGKAACPKEAIPTTAGLGEWLREGDYPDELIFEANEHLARVLPGAIWIAPIPTDRIPDHPELELPPVVAVLSSALQAAIPELSERAKRRVSVYYPIEDVDRKLKDVCNETGKRLLHPAAPLVRAWQERPRQGLINLKTDRILPGRLAMIDDPAASPAFRTLFSPALRAGGPDRQLRLPGFDRAQAGPVLPLELYDLGAGNEAERRGRAAPLALRIWIESILAVHYEDRGHSDMRPIDIAMTFREFLDRIYPGGRKPRPHEYYPRLRRAAEALASDAARIPWQDPDNPKIGGFRTIVSIPDIPASLDSPFRVRVNLPPGAVDGPAMPASLPYWGVRSAAGYRALIGLGFRWHQPGRTRHPVRGGKHWIYSNDPADYDRITDDELLSLCFPTSTKKHRGSMLRDARQTLKTLIDAGEARMIDGRILPPAAGKTAKPKDEDG